MIEALGCIVACGIAVAAFWVQIRLQNWRQGRLRSVYQCPVCKLEFADPALASQCQQWCLTHNSCNLEVARQAINKGSVLAGKD